MLSDRTEVLSYVIDLCHKNLAHDEVAYRYLTVTRNLSDESIKTFKLGSFPQSTKELAKNVDVEVLKELKIAWLSQFSGDGPCKFRDSYNLITPIYDTYGIPIAISGRFLGPEASRKTLGLHKYDNSDYSKHSNLFGMHLAKPHILQKDKVLVVEGQFDVIKAHQHGIKNVVATAGAFLKLEQLAILARYTKNIYLGFDNDEAGTLAINRSLTLKRTGIELIEKRVPSQFKDLDEYLDKKAA
mgnify:CR=1 FL=1